MTMTSTASPVPGSTILGYDDLFNFPHYSNTQLPYQFEQVIIFKKLYSTTPIYTVANVVANLLTNVNYSENVSFGYSNYDMVVSMLNPNILGNQAVKPMPAIPAPIQAIVVNYVINIMNTPGLLPTVLPATVTVQVPSPLNAASLVNTNYTVNITKDALLNTVFTVTGSWGGLRKFVDALPILYIPTSLPQNVITWNNMAIGVYDPLHDNIPVAVPNLTAYPGEHYYEIAAVNYTQYLHSDLQKPTNLRGFVQITGYDALGNPTYNPNDAHHLGPVFFAKKDIAVRVKFYNLLDSSIENGKLPIPCDTTYMGAGEGPNGTNEEYSQNRVVIHMHGGNTPWTSDGTVNQWIAPKTQITDYKQGASVIHVPDMTQPKNGDGVKTYYYTNNQTCRFMWYHDHTYGITRLNVYMGLVSAYSLTDSVEQSLMDDIHLPDVNHTFPLIIQEKTFLPNDEQLQYADPTWIQHRNTLNPQWGVAGDLWLPHVWAPNQNPNVTACANDLGRWDYGPWFWPPYTGLENQELVDSQGRRYPNIPNPTGTPESFCDTPLVNGKAYPFMNVESRAYRFNILNAMNDRTINLSLFKAASNDLTDCTFDINGNVIPICLDSGETVMKPANPGQPGWPASWPTDGRDGGVPDPATCGPNMYQIQNECGFLPKVSVLTNQPVAYEYNRRNIVVLDIRAGDGTNLYLCPAERASFIIDFSAYKNGDIILLYNDCACPNPGFDPRNDYYTGSPDNSTSGGTPSTLKGFGPNSRTIMQFRIVNTGLNGAVSKANDPSMIANLNNTVQNAFLACGQDHPIIPTPEYDDLWCVSNRGGDCSIYETPVVGLIDSDTLSFKNLNNSANVTPTITGGAITRITVNDSGADYIPATTVVKIDPPPNAIQALATAVVTKNPTGNNFTVSAITIKNGGTGYTSVPNVYIGYSNAIDTQATAIAVVNSLTGTITSIVPNVQNFGYYTAPNVTIDPPTLSGGIQATATAVILNGKIVGFTITNPGTLYDSECLPIVTIDAPQSDVITGASLGMAGMSGMNAGTAIQATATATITGGIVTSITITNPGTGYDPNNLPSIFIDQPVSAIINPNDITFATGYISNIVNDSPGSGYTQYTSLSVTGGFGDGAVLVPVLSNGQVANIKIKDYGYGYFNTPIITIDPPGVAGGITALATAFVNGRGQITGVTVTNPGSGYSAPLDTTTGTLMLPNITVTCVKGATDALPALNYTISTGEIDSVNVITGGYGYANNSQLNLVIGAPSVGGIQATGYAVTNNMSEVTSIVITNSGSGYTASPTISISGTKPIFAAKLSVIYIPVGGISTISIRTRGTGLSSKPKINLIDLGYTTVDATGATVQIPGGSGALFNFQSKLTTSIESIRITNGGSGYNPLAPPKVSVVDNLGTYLTYDIDSPAIQELFEPRRGRMNATFGVEIANTNVTVQTTIPYGFIDPPAPCDVFNMNIWQIGPVRGDGSRILKIVHNGVDTHSVHFHLMQMQVLNRVGWDGMTEPPLPAELGWKESIKMQALRMVYVLMRPVPPPLPWAVPDSIRPYAVTMPLGMTSNYDFQNVAPDGSAITVTNDLNNFGHEYMVHCHILGHEENDMMRSYTFYLQYNQPYKAALNAIANKTGTTTNSVSLNWSFAKNKPANLNYDPSEFYNIIIERCVDDGFNGITNVVLADIIGVNRNLNVKSLAFNDTTVSALSSNVGIVYYRVTTVNSFGSSYSTIIPIVINSIPTLLCSYDGLGNIILNWAGVLNTTGYTLTIYANTIAAPATYALKQTTSFNSSILTYIYKVPTITVKGTTFRFQLTCTTPAGTTLPAIYYVNWAIPTAVTNLAINNIDGVSGIISWTAPVLPQYEPSITSYTLTVGTDIITLPGTSTSYIYSPATPFTAGVNYSINIVASNPVGKSVAAVLNVLWGLPIAPRNFAITPNSITFLQDVNPGLVNLTSTTITISQLLAGRTTTLPAITFKYPAITASTVIQTLSESVAFTPVLNATYALNAYTSNSSGNSSTTTLNVYWAVQAAPTSVGVTSSTISWIPAALVVNEPIITGYSVTIVDVSAANKTTTTVITNPAALSMAWAPTSGHSYRISVSTTNIVGNSLATTVNILYTLPTAPIITGATPTNINWTEIIPVGTSITNYIINISDTYNNTTTNLPAINALGTVLTSLWSPQTGHTYSITVTAYNIFSSTSSIPFVIYYDIPPVPTNLTLTATNLTWTASSYPVIATNYLPITYTVTTQDTFGGVTTTTTVTGITTTSLAKVPVLNHQYVFSIVAINSAGTSSAASLTQLWSVLNAPTSLLINSPTTFTWTPVLSDPNIPTVINYTLKVYSLATLVQTVSSTTTTATISQLTTGSTYSFTLTANNLVGSSLAASLNNIVYASASPVTGLTVVPNLISWVLSANPVVPNTAINVTITNNTTPSLSQLLTLAGTATSTSFIMAQNSSYSVSIVVVNMFGTSAATTYSFTSNVVSTPTALAFGATSINWAITTPISNIYQDTGYILTITPTLPVATSIVITLPAGSLSYAYGSGAFTPVLGTTYSATIAAIGTTGNSVASTPVNINWSLPFSVTSLTYASGLVTWVNPTLSSGVPPINSYVLTVISNPVSTPTVKTTNVYTITGITTSYTLGDIANYNYTLSLTDTNIVGNSAPTSYIFTSFVPPAPHSITYSAATHNIAFLAGNTPTTNIPLPTTSYTIVVYNGVYSNATLLTSKPVPIVNTNIGLSLSYLFSNVIIGGRYTVVTYANNIYGTSTVSNTLNFIG